MSIILSETLEKATCFLKSHLQKNKFFVKIENESITKFSGSKRGNKVYAYKTELKIKPIIESLIKNKTARFITLTHQYDTRNPLESWTYMKNEIPRFIRKSKFESYLYIYEAHKNGGCHCHIIATGKISNDKIKSLWNGHIKIKKIQNAKIGAYLSKEVGKAGHVESALKNWDSGKISDNDVKKIWRFYYLLKLKMRGWGTSRKLNLIKNKIDSYTESCELKESSDSIKEMNNSTTDNKSINEIVIALPKKITKNSNFRPYCGKLDKNQSDYQIIIEYLISLKIPLPIKIPIPIKQSTQLKQLN